MKIGFLALVLGYAVAVAPATAQDKEAAQIDRAARQHSEQSVLDHLSGELGVSAATLRQEKQNYNLSYGQLFIAHRLATASGRSLNSVVSEFRSGKGFGQIAKENNVKLGPIVSDARQQGHRIQEMREDRRDDRRERDKENRRELKERQKEEKRDMKERQRTERERSKGINGGRPDKPSPRRGRR